MNNNNSCCHVDQSLVVSVFIDQGICNVCLSFLASFTKEVDLRLDKLLLKINGRLANRGLASLVKEDIAGNKVYFSYYECLWCANLQEASSSLSSVSCLMSSSAAELLSLSSYLFHARFGIKMQQKLQTSCSRCNKTTWHVESNYILQPPKIFATHHKSI